MTTRKNYAFFPLNKLKPWIKIFEFFVKRFPLIYFEI